MSCYVDRVQSYPTSIRCFAGGSCHLIADTLDELHTMARRIGLKRVWFQDKPHCRHYDLTPARRAKAVELGAVECDRTTFVGHMRRIRVEQGGPNLWGADNG